MHGKTTIKVCFSVVFRASSNVFRRKKYLIELHSRWSQQGMCVFIYCPLVSFTVTTVNPCHHSLAKLLSTKYCDNLYVFHIRAFVGFLDKYNNIVTSRLSVREMLHSYGQTDRQTDALLLYFLLNVQKMLRLIRLWN